MTSRRFITLLYVVLLSAFGVAAGALFLDTRAEYTQLRQTEFTLRKRLADTQARLDEKERALDRLNNDPKFIEKAIREKLHYAKQNELIYRFEN